MRRARWVSSRVSASSSADVFECELLRLEEGVLLVEGGVVEQFASRDSQGVGNGLDDVGGGVLAALLDVAQVALRDARLVGEGLQGEVPV